MNTWPSQTFGGESGTVGKGVHTGPPRGIHRNGEVVVNYAEAVQSVVRSGLRATR